MPFFCPVWLLIQLPEMARNLQSGRVESRDDYVLACYRYIELNPVRANMVDHTTDYHWSSYTANALGENSTLLTPHTLYTALGRGPKSRQAAYRTLFRHQLEPEMIDDIRNATIGNFALGSLRFQKEIAATLGRRVARGKAGRPKQNKNSNTGDLFDKLWLLILFVVCSVSQ